MQNVDIIGYIAAFLTTLSFIPQAIKTIRTKDTKALSFWMYLLSFVGVVFWLVFGLMIGSYPVIFKNILVIILSGIILSIKTKHIIEGEEDIKKSKLFKNKTFRNLLEFLRK